MGFKLFGNSKKIELEEDLRIIKPEQLLAEIQEGLKEDNKSESETISVEVNGGFSFEVVENEHRMYHRDSTHYIVVKYIADVEYLNEKLNTTGKAMIDASKDSYGRSVKSIFTVNNEEEAYLYLERILNEEKESDCLMDRIRKDIEYKIREHEKSKRINEIKKRIAENTKFELKMSFDMKNPK